MENPVKGDFARSVDTVYSNSSNNLKTFPKTHY